MLFKPDDLPDQTRATTKAELEQFLNRALNLEDEIAEAQAGRRDFWREVKGRGFDVPALKALVKERRGDSQKLAEQRELTDFYRDILDEGVAPPREKPPAETGAAASMKLLPAPGQAEGGRERYVEIARQHGIADEIAHEVYDEDQAEGGQLVEFSDEAPASKAKANPKPKPKNKAAPAPSEADRARRRAANREATRRWRARKKAEAQTATAAE